MARGNIHNLLMHERGARRWRGKKSKEEGWTVAGPASLVDLGGRPTYCWARQSALILRSHIVGEDTDEGGVASPQVPISSAQMKNVNVVKAQLWKPKTVNKLSHSSELSASLRSLTLLRAQRRKRVYPSGVPPTEKEFSREHFRVLRRSFSQYINFEFCTIKAQDRGRGVICAATCIEPAVLVPRPWDSPDLPSGLQLQTQVPPPLAEVPATVPVPTSPSQAAPPVSQPSSSGLAPLPLASPSPTTPNSSSSGSYSNYIGIESFSIGIRSVICLSLRTKSHGLTSLFLGSEKRL
ncbi:hypothetical protein F5888DRAFT_1642447 [Russula emetica]|nr:hypothetical protein F5888DRAFT_1642447 [Russula emetica]